jgi:predicted nucleic acid-binding protein
MLHVIDCSFSSALFLPDENSESVREFFLKMKKNDRVHIPLLWWYETGNVLNVSVRRKRLNHNDFRMVIDLLVKLRLITDAEYGAEYSGRLFELSQLYNVSSYDAAYLELSIRLQAKLQTLDKNLLAVADTIGIKTG